MKTVWIAGVLIILVAVAIDRVSNPGSAALEPLAGRAPPLMSLPSLSAALPSPIEKAAAGTFDVSEYVRLHETRSETAPVPVRVRRNGETPGQ